MHADATNRDDLAKAFLGTVPIICDTGVQQTTAARDEFRRPPGACRGLYHHVGHDAHGRPSQNATAEDHQ